METTRLATIVTAALAIVPICAAQSPKLLQITSPANGAIVSPGETVKVTVASPANVRFDMVALLSPIGDGTSVATFSDGRILEVTESSRVTYRSSNTRVALVDRHGAITPVGIGSASVTATYANGNRNVRIAIPVNVKLTPY